MSFSITIQINCDPEKDGLRVRTGDSKSKSRHIQIEQGDAVVDIDVLFLQQSDIEIETLSPLENLKSKVKKAIQLPLFDEDLLLNR